MKYLLLIAACILISLVNAQELDLIVTTKLDSISCEIVNRSSEQVTYSITGQLDTISTEQVYYVQKRNWKRPKYYNTDVEIERADVEVESIMLQNTSTTPVQPPIVGSIQHIEQIENRLNIAGKRFQTAGVLMLSSVALTTIGTLLLASASDYNTGGYAALGLGGVCMIASYGFIIGGGKALRKK